MGFTEILILAVIIIVVFGSSKIPQLGKGLGEGIRNFKKGMRGEGDIDVTDTVKRIKEDDKA